MVEKKCEYCGQAVFIHAYHANRGRGRYCSKTCFNLGRQRQVKKECLVCGSVFFVPHCHQDRIKTCSKECKSIRYKEMFRGRQRSLEWGNNISRGKAGKPNPKLKKPTISRICENCGNQYFISRSRSKKQQQSSRFCSIECWYVWIRQDSSRHPSWTGGYYPYYGPNWQDQARQARERDNHVCQQCGAVEHKVVHDVHHVIPFRQFSSWEEANELSNLITLCKSCHASIPNKGGDYHQRNEHRYPGCGPGVAGY